MTKRVRDAAEVKKRKAARLRFRNLIRSVALNRIWLMDPGDQKLSLNVKKNISMLVRTRRKIGLLTMAEKSLIRTPFSLRTTEQRKQLITLMANLTCLSKVPPKVRARLGRVVNFMVIGGGRTIIKEGHIPSTVYFILTGEVEVSKRVYDRITKRYVQKVDVIMGSGECIGHAEMLDNCPRRNTYVSTGVVELLVVLEGDFNKILKPSMLKQWEERKNALKALEYFQYFTDDQLTDACKMSTLRQFDPLETIYHEDKSQAGDVHFVVSGVCMILQCLRMRVTEKDAIKSYELTDLNKEESRSMFQDSSHLQVMKALRNQGDGMTTNVYDIDALLVSDEEEEHRQKTRNIDIKNVEAQCDFLKKKSASLVERSSETTSSTTSDVSMDDNKRKYKFRSLYSYDLDGYEWGEVGSEYKYKDDEEEDGIEKFSGATDRGSQAHVAALLSKYEEYKHKLRKKSKRSKEIAEMYSMEEETPYENNGSVPVQEDFVHHVMSNNSVDGKEFTELSAQTLQTMDNYSSIYKIRTAGFSTIENHFIDVGSLTFGAIFGLGEKMEHRVIMARTTVQCLILPRYWLLNKQQNLGNIWQRRRFYLDSTIPSRETLFQDFLSTRQWHKFKKRIIEKNLDPNSHSNPTRIQDVPIICQIVEGNDN